MQPPPQLLALQVSTWFRQSAFQNQYITHALQVSTLSGLESLEVKHHMVATKTLAQQKKPKRPPQQQPPPKQPPPPKHSPPWPQTVPYAQLLNAETAQAAAAESRAKYIIKLPPVLLPTSSASKPAPSPVGGSNSQKASPCRVSQEIMASPWTPAQLSEEHVNQLYAEYTSKSFYE